MAKLRQKLVLHIDKGPPHGKCEVVPRGWLDKQQDQETAPAVGSGTSIRGPGEAKSQGGRPGREQRARKALKFRKGRLARVAAM